ncbi:hypothetical protein ACFV2N_46265 [Streptomyces sp. NPDC059680]|uniref:hypothetical protein n=1 Tax=Streptomyces sp. NPDC059680 TaxID=3346904 RepID=UPI0036925203
MEDEVLYFIHAGHFHRLFGDMPRKDTIMLGREEASSGGNCVEAPGNMFGTPNKNSTAGNATTA